MKGRMVRRGTSRRNTPRCSRRIHRTLATILCTMWVTSPAVSQDESPDTDIPDTIVVTAEAPASSPDPGVTVIDVDEARLRGEATLADILDRQVEVTIQHRGSAFEPATLRIRGSTAEQVRVLRDGVALSDSRASGTDVSTIPLAGIERVEIIRGAATARYGPGAAAGAINLISKDADSRSASGRSGVARIRVGSLGEVRGDGRTEVDFGSTVAVFAVDGVFAGNTYEYERAGSTYRRENGGGAGGGIRVELERAVAQNGDSVVTGHAETRLTDRGLAGSVEFPSAAARLRESSAAAGLRFSGQAPGGSRTLVAHATGHYRVREFSDTEYPLGAIDETAAILAGTVGASGSWMVPAGLEAGLGIEGSGESMEDARLGRRTRTSVAVAPEISWASRDGARGQVKVAVNSRVDLVDGRADPLLPSIRVTAAWSRRGRTRTPRVAIAVGTGSRLPSYSELFWPAGAFAVGNPALQPEQSRSAELSLAVRRPGFGAIEMRAHGTWYEELIEWIPDPRGVWQPRNTGLARILGIEGELSGERALGVSPWDAFVSFTGAYLDARDRSPGATYDRTLPYRPRLRGGGTIGLSHLTGHRLELSATAVGTRPITAANTRSLEPYLDIALSGRWAIPASPVVFGAAINNLLDTGFVETRFYPNPGRELRMFVEVKW